MNGSEVKTMYEKRESGRRETIKAKSVVLRESRIGASIEVIFRLCFGIVLCSTEVELFVLVESRVILQLNGVKLTSVSERRKIKKTKIFK